MAPYTGGRTLPRKKRDEANRRMDEFDAVRFGRNQKGLGKGMQAAYDIGSDSVILDCGAAVDSLVIGRYHDHRERTRGWPVHMRDAATHKYHSFVTSLRHELAHWDLGQCPHNADKREIILQREEIRETLLTARDLRRDNPGGYRAWVFSDASREFRHTIVPPYIRKHRLLAGLMDLSCYSFTLLKAAARATGEIQKNEILAVDNRANRLGINHVDEALACLMGGGKESYQGFLGSRGIPLDDEFAAEVWSAALALKERHAPMRVCTIVREAATQASQDDTSILPLLRD